MMRSLLCASVLMAACGSATTAWAGFPGFRAYFVNAAADGVVQDGNSWQSAFLTIQDALDAAMANSAEYPFPEVWVANGFYRPTRSFNTTPEGDAVYSLEIRGNVKVLGGFSGRESSPDERRGVLGEVVISPIQPDNGISGVTVRVYENGVLERVRIADVGFNQPTFRKFNGVGVFGNGELRDVTIVGNMIGDNVATVRAGGNARLTNVTVQSSFSDGNGHAGVRIDGNVRFFGGEVSGTSTGSAGIDVVSGSPVIRRVLITNNVSRTAAVRATPGTILLNCPIFNNNNVAPGLSGTSAVVGGQIVGCYLFGNYGDEPSLPTIRNATVMNSTVIQNRRGVLGGRIDNSIIWNNGDDPPDGTLEDQIMGDIPAERLRSNIIKGWVADDSSNIGDDPMIADPLTSPNPSPGSPAIDSGDNTIVPRGLFADVLGSRRYWNAVSAGPARIDRGAIEAPDPNGQINPNFCFADFNQRGSVDASDFAEFLQFYVVAHPLGDVNADGFIDNADLVRFMELYNTGCAG